MFQFLEAYHRRGETTTSDLLSAIQIGLWQDKSSADPTQLGDFLNAVRAVKDLTGCCKTPFDAGILWDFEVSGV
jgi:hypothetical protein